MHCLLNDRLSDLMKSMGIDLARLQGMMNQEAVPDPYAVLGLDNSASDDQVKTRYHELLHKLHPDTSGTEDTTFLLQMVMAVYEIIKGERGLS